MQAIPRVALRTEGVDRNAMSGDDVDTIPVALRTEGVDRNRTGKGHHHQFPPSPSVRRAWIEISGICSRLQARKGRPPHGGRG